MNSLQKKRKILYLITKSNWGGAQRYVYDLATALPQETFEVVVALGGTGMPGAAAGKLATRLAEKGVRTVVVRSFAREIFPFLDVRAFFEIMRILRREKPDIVHTNSSKAGGIGSVAARLMRTPRIVFTSHGLAFEEDRKTLSRVFMRLATWLTFLFSHTVITISNATYERARAMLFARNKVVLIPNGIPYQKRLGRNAARRRLELRTTMHIPRDVPWIGSIAELTKNKGLKYAIEACALLKRREQPLVYVIIGAGEDLRALKAVAERFDVRERVYFLGFVEDAHQYLTAFDIFVLPSVKEGHPYVLLEASQAGLPVVGSNIPGIQDFIIEDETGLLSEPAHPSDLSEKLSLLIKSEDKRERLGTNLRIRTTERFSFEKMLDKTLGVYQNYAPKNSLSASSRWMLRP